MNQTNNIKEIKPEDNNFYFFKNLRLVTPKKQERYLRVMKK